MEFEKNLSKQEFIDLLDQLKAAIQNESDGNFVMDGKTLNLPSDFSCEIEYDDESEQVELEIELKWNKKLQKDVSPTSVGRFETFQGKDDKWHWHLKAPNGQIILASQSYTTKDSAKKSINSVKENSVKDNFESRVSKSGQPYFILKAKNGEIIGTSQMYKRKAGCQKGIQSVIHNRNSEIV